MSKLERFRPHDYGVTGLFLDTSGLFPLFHERSSRHSEAARLFDAVNSGALPYRPLYVNQHVLDETATMLTSRVSTDAAINAVDTLATTSTVEIIQVGETDVQRTVDNLRRYRDVEIAFTDHTVGVQATKLNVDHVFTYDGDFETLGLTTIPH